MKRLLRLIVCLLLATAVADAQGNLSELFSILASEGPSLSASARTRTFAILEPYEKGEKSLDGEWQSFDAALNGATPYMRDQACAALAAILYVNSTRAAMKTSQPIRLPDTTIDLIIQRLGETKANLRENAVRILALMAGGVPPKIESQLLQMARNDSESSVRQIAIAALASVHTANPEITEFWVQSLKNVQDTDLRGMVLSAFRDFAPTDPRIIALVVDALKDTDYFVRQQAIAAVIKIGKPAAAALPRLNEIRNAQVGSSDRDEAMRMNAEAAIRILERDAGKSVMPG